MPKWGTRLIHSGVIASNVAAFILVQHEVPEPYLDEIFHIPQAQRYCSGDWRYWDPSITTPPGLYILAVLPLRLLHLPCSPTFLRLTNLILGTLVIPTLISAITSSTRRTWRHHLLHPSAESRILSFFPFTFFFSLLFYTDVGSLTAVLAAYAFAAKDEHILAAVVGTVSLWFRQTNVVWVAFIMATSLLKCWKGENGASSDPVLASVRSLHDVGEALRNVLTSARHRRISTAKVSAPYLPVFAAFVAFLKWNGGIVLGHKEMHVAVAHVPQMLYFMAFATVMLAPALMSGGVIELVRGTLTGAFGSKRKTAVFAVLLLLINTGVYFCTIEHPFLLADNRHYTFYVWRRIIKRHALARYALTPVYALCSYAWLHALRHRVTLFWAIGFVACTALVLIPTPLIEPRYFLIPLMILRLRLSPSRRYLALEAVMYLTVNIVTVYIFLKWPFEWEGWQGRMRFMW